MPHTQEDRERIDKQGDEELQRGVCTLPVTCHRLSSSNRPHTMSRPIRTTATRYWPPEWAKHSATVLLYPHNPKTFRPRAHGQFVSVVKAIAGPTETALVLSPRPVPDLDAIPFVEVRVCPSNDSWARDTAPTIIIEDEGDVEGGAGDGAGTEPPTVPVPGRRRKLVGLDWDFNAYGGPELGGCYWPCDLDRNLAGEICRSILRISTRKVPLVLEGGSIHTDGIGTVLTTERCLLNPNRNPSMSKDEIERMVLEATGCTKMIWLPLGLAHDDDTDDHVDNFACFVRPRHVVLAWTDDEVGDKDNYDRCRQAKAILEEQTDAGGNSLVVHELHLPRPMFYARSVVDELNAAPAPDHTVVPPRIAGERMAASYVNFYIANEAVVVPQFGDGQFDKRAVETLQGLFPDRRVVGVASDEILVGGGNIHCITQQVPALP
jgi:agmatine deiminase